MFFRSVAVSWYRSGLPDFSWCNIPKWENIYQRTTEYVYSVTIKYNRLPHKMALKMSKHFLFMGLKNFPKMGFFGMPIYHLATLAQTRNRRRLNAKRLPPFPGNPSCRYSAERRTLSPSHSCIPVSATRNYL
jgi:hypothetical protein